MGFAARSPTCGVKTYSNLCDLIPAVRRKAISRSPKGFDKAIFA